MKSTISANGAQAPASVPIAEESGIARPPAWEMIETGRYRPRRIKGSLLGRELG
jgi:hypothetical protein